MIQAIANNNARRVTAASPMPSFRALRFSTAREDGDEDDVVDAQHQLQCGERCQRDPDFRVGERFHAAFWCGERQDEGSEFRRRAGLLP